MFDNSRRLFYVFFLSIYSFLNIKFTEGDSLLSLQVNDLTIFTYLLVIVWVLWEGNKLLAKLFESKINLTLVKRLIFQFSSSMLLIAIVPIIISGCYMMFFPELQFNILYRLTLGFSFRINLFLHCVNAIVVYNKELTATKVVAESLTKKNTEAQLDALRKQINPHFLFNSLNVLVSIIEKNQSLAVKFVEELSDVYRHHLKSQEAKLSPLKKEIEFLNSYLFLLKMRFQENLQVTIETDGGAAYYLPPSTLQLLIENTIKHNEVSKAKPLVIKIIQKGDELVVSNSLNPKVSKQESLQLGLNNIISRYELLGARKPQVTKSVDQFQVNVALLRDID